MHILRERYGVSYTSRYTQNTHDGGDRQDRWDVVFTIKSHNYIRRNYLNFPTFQDIKTPVGVTWRRINHSSASNLLEPKRAYPSCARIDLRFIGRFSGADIRIISALAEIIEANQLYFRGINSDHTFPRIFPRILYGGRRRG